MLKVHRICLTGFVSAYWSAALLSTSRSVSQVELAGSQRSPPPNETGNSSREGQAIAVMVHLWLVRLTCNSPSDMLVYSYLLQQPKSRAGKDTPACLHGRVLHRCGRISFETDLLPSRPTVIARM